MGEIIRPFEPTSIFIANTSNAKIELKAIANIKAKKLDIADAKFEFRAIFYKGLNAKIIARTGLSSLFKVKGLNTRIFLPPIFNARGLVAFDLVAPTGTQARNSS